MNDEIKINPLLINALEHYARGFYFDMNKQTFLVQERPDGTREAWPVEKTCALAAEVLSYEEIAYLKLRALQSGMKRMGMEDVYEHIMGEKLP